MNLGKNIILGSSRSIRWGNKETDTLLPISNLSVSTASLEEMAGLYEAVIEKGQWPEQLTLSLDPWMINKNALGDDQEWLDRTSFDDHFRQRVLQDFNQINAIDNIKISIDSYVDFVKRLINYERLYSSIKFLNKNGLKIKKLYNLQSPESLELGDYAIRPDGVLIYPHWVFSKSQEKIDLEARETPDPSKDYVFKNFTVSPEKWRILQGIIDDAKSKGIRVMVISPPFHPETFKRLNYLPMYKEAIEKWRSGLKKISDQVIVCDFTDPKSVSCFNSDFIDGTHMGLSCVRKVFQKCTAGFGDH